MNKFEDTEIFYIIACNIFDENLFLILKHLLAFISALRYSFLSSYPFDKFGYPVWDKMDYLNTLLEDLVKAF